MQKGALIADSLGEIKSGHGMIEEALKERDFSLSRTE